MKTAVSLCSTTLTRFQDKPPARARVIKDPYLFSRPQNQILAVLVVNLQAPGQEADSR